MNQQINARSRAFPLSIALVAVALLIASGTGCTSQSASPQLQVARQEQAFTFGMEAVNAGLQSGQLDTEAFSKLRPLVVAVNGYLDDAKASAVEIGRLEAAIAQATDADRAALQLQLDVQRDAFTRVMKSLTAAMKAFNAAQQEVSHADVPSPVQPSATAGPERSPGGDREPASVRRPDRRQWLDHAPAIAVA